MTTPKALNDHELLERLAKVVAECVSGCEDAIPEQFDHDLAKDIFVLIGNRMGW